MGADGPGATAEITLTPCISLNAEKAGTDVAVMTVGNSPGPTELPPYQNNSQSIPNPDKLSRSQRSGDPARGVPAKPESCFIGELNIDPPEAE